jgi:hypothetical protein
MTSEESDDLKRRLNSVGDLVAVGLAEIRGDLSKIYARLEKIETALASLGDGK